MRENIVESVRGKSNVLFVDDDEATLEIMKAVLCSEKHNVITKLSGEEGLQYIKENGPVAIVVSDCRMDGMNGLEFLEVVRLISPLTKRCLCSGFFNSLDLKDKVMSQQIHAHIVKPIDIKKMISIVNELVQDFETNIVGTPIKDQSKEVAGE
jgi:response regulator RpfG family c-di-GMP phosphodiesterase